MTTSMVEVSLKAKETRHWDNEIRRCWALFESLGVASPKWRSLNAGKVPDAAKLVQQDTFKGKLKCAQVTAARKLAETFLLYCASLNWQLDTLTEWQIATYLRERKLQSPTAPRRAHHSLRWLASVSGIQLHVDDPSVCSQSNVDKSAGKPEPPVPAKVPPLAMLAQMEEAVFTATTPVLQ